MHDALIVFNTKQGGAKNFWLRGRDNIIILICNSRKIQSMIYIHIYMSSCISFRKKKTLNLTKIRLHLQEIRFIEIKI